MRPMSGAAPAAILAGLAVPAAAQETITLAPIIVESFRMPTIQSAIPGTVEIIDGEEIVDSGKDVSQFLGSRVAGLAPSNGSILSNANQKMRGRHVQVLINGIPRVSALNGISRELALIDPSSIARIEVIKGATALYGNGAAGGIINIITRAADKEGLSFGGLTRFSFNSADPDDSLATDLSAYMQYREGDFGVRVDLGTTLTDGRFDGSGDLMPADPMIGQGGGSDLERYALSATVDYAIDEHEFEFHGNFVRIDQDIGHFADYATDPVSADFSNPYTGEDVEDETMSFSGTYRNRETLLGDLNVTAFYSKSEQRTAFVPFGPANPLVYYSGDPSGFPAGDYLSLQDPDMQSLLDTEIYGVRATLTHDFDVVTVTAGVDYQHDNIRQTMLDGRDTITPLEQDSIAGFVQVDVPIGDMIDLSGGVRYEKFFLDVGNFTRPAAIYGPLLPYFPAFGPIPAVDVTGGDFEYDALVFNLGGVLHATDEIDVFAGFHQGFSIPDVGSFTRRAMNANPFDPSPISFASIRPEAAIVNSYEIGARYDNDRVHAAVAGFVSTSEEGTTFDPATNEITQQEEIIWGAELNIAADVTEDLMLGTVLAYQEGKYDSDDNGSVDSYLPNNRIVSPFTATVYGDYAVTPKLDIGVEFVFTAGRDRDPAFDLDDTHTVNVHASYDLGPGEIQAGIWNLFDTAQLNPTATSVRNIPVADEGRRIWMGYQFEF